jgi:pimeloyl-ACP methyl ester carboxylesterase
MTPILLCLHGWGGSKESFAPLRDALSDSTLTILTPDLPGFGDEPEPSKPWTIDDYALWVEEWYRRHTPPSEHRLLLLGHSHGGRIAIRLADRGILPITHLFLCAAAGIRRPKHARRIVGVTLAKLGAAFFSLPGMRRLEPSAKKLLYKLFRVHDYEKASPVMRQTMINVTKEDLRSDVADIRIPTDLFWGTDDTMTPLADGKLMHRLIAGSTLHVYPGVRHAVHKEKANEIAAILRTTLA